jgi:hypothetical protein
MQGINSSSREADMKFFVGLHQPSDAKHFDFSFISVNRLLNRKSDFEVNGWIMDSGAFSQIYNNGVHMPVEDYAKVINRFKNCGKLLAAVTQDFMCEAFILKKTGMTVLEHQQKTIERYIQIKALTDVYIMPVLQGYDPDEYLQHIDMYGDLLPHGAYVGVGSVCKRNSRPMEALEVFRAIKRKRPDLRLHGFGLKRTALEEPRIKEYLESSDSMAWSFAARKAGRDANSWLEAKSYEQKVKSIKFKPYQLTMMDCI